MNKASERCLYRPPPATGYGGYYPSNCSHDVANTERFDVGVEVAPSKCLFKPHPIPGYGGAIPRDCKHTLVTRGMTGLPDIKGASQMAGTRGGADSSAEQSRPRRGQGAVVKSRNVGPSKCLYKPNIIPGYCGHVPAACLHRINRKDDMGNQPGVGRGRGKNGKLSGGGDTLKGKGDVSKGKGDTILKDKGNAMNGKGDRVAVKSGGKEEAGDKPGVEMQKDMLSKRPPDTVQCLYTPEPIPGYAGNVPAQCVHGSRGLKHSPAGINEAERAAGHAGAVGGNAGAVGSPECLYQPDPIPGYAGHIPLDCYHSAWAGRAAKHSPTGLQEASTALMAGATTADAVEDCLFDPDPIPGYAGHVPSSCQHGWSRGAKLSPTGVAEGNIGSRRANEGQDGAGVSAYSDDAKGTGDGMSCKAEPGGECKGKAGMGESVAVKPGSRMVNKEDLGKAPVCVSDGHMAQVKPPAKKEMGRGDCLYKPNPISNYAGFLPPECLHGWKRGVKVTEDREAPCIYLPEIKEDYGGHIPKKCLHGRTDVERQSTSLWGNFPQTAGGDAGDISCLYKPKPAGNYGGFVPEVCCHGPVGRGGTMV